jgi:Ca2+-binding RTX toxin-like protein
MDQQLAAAGVLMSDGAATVQGGAADELLVSTNGPGRNILVGGGGDDTYVVYSASTITEAAGGGFDAVYLVDADLAPGFVLPANVEMITLEAGITGNAARNFINSTTGTVRALGGDDVIHGGEEVNVIYGGAGNDNMTGNQGDDRLYGDAGRDTLEGGAGNDTMAGGGGADTIDASSGGADILDFNAVSESTPTASDVILGFRGAGPTLDDRFDLSTIDANARVAGNQAFAFGGTGTGKIWLATLGTDTLFFANVDADAAAELRIVIRDGSVAASAYTAADFIL